MYTQAQDGDAFGRHRSNARDEERWRSALATLANRWPVLTSQELEATHGRPELVASMLEAKIGFAQLLARDALRAQPKQRGLSDYSPVLLQSAGYASALGAMVLIVMQRL